MVPLVGELAIPAARTASLGADVELKSVSEQAVVCDLCASAPAGDPNCVYACPHDAALRVDAAEFFQAQSAEGALRGR